LSHCRSPLSRALTGVVSLATLAICFGGPLAIAQTQSNVPSVGGPAIGNANSQGQTGDAAQVVKRKAKDLKRAPSNSLRSTLIDKSLPPLAPYPGANRIGLRGGVIPAEPGKPAPTIAAIALPDARHRPAPDDAPFESVGVNLGSLRLKPYFEEDAGYASNPGSQTTRPKGSAFETSEAGLGFQSDWPRNDVRGNLRAGYTDYFADRSANTPYGSGAIAGRFDISRNYTVDAETHFDIRTQTPGSVTLPSGAVLSASRRPLVDTFGGSVGATSKFGDAALSLHGTFDRTIFDNAQLSGGAIADLSSDDSNDWGLRARAAYEASPVVAPFVEIDADKRIYDSVRDSSGFQRDSRGVAALAGATLALTGQLTGEASAGYGTRNFQDTRLPDLNGPLFNAALAWAVTPLTKVTVKAATTLADTTTPGASGAVSRNYTIGVAHALLRNLTLTANAGYATDTYSGVSIHDSTTTFALGADYNLSRDLVLKASASRQQFSSSLPNSSYSSNIFMLGLRVQR